MNFSQKTQRINEIVEKKSNHLIFLLSFFQTQPHPILNFFFLNFQPSDVEKKNAKEKIYQIFEKISRS